MKTVYVLGAGFSAGVKNHAGIRIPSQEKLVEEIFNHRGHFVDEAEEFEKFLTDVMGIPVVSHYAIPLEDIFTPLDKCIADGISFRSINANHAKRIRELVDYLIAKTLDVILMNVNKVYVDTFAKHLVGTSSVRADGGYINVDPVSAISTNWDILLDKSIKESIELSYSTPIAGKKLPNAVVDYCCQLSSFEPNDESVKPGIEVLGQGGFNVKLLKLHGSLNWLQCPRCNRLYVDFTSKISVTQYIDKRHCRHCDSNFGACDSHILISNLIMPTFIKNLSNPQYKIIWYNAAIELSEASKVVFIGYSLPPADFEMKQMLSRMLRSNADIEVVDLGASAADPKIVDMKSRYEVFFGRTVVMHHQGVIEYVDNHLV